MSQNQQDELARLFARNMNVSQASPQEAVVVEQVVQTPEKLADDAVHFMSSHYTRTAHLRPATTSPPPPYHEAIAPHGTAYILRQHSIDPAALLPTQIRLFENANYEQRLRLLELWRISPPAYTHESRRIAAMAPTTVEQEEAEAKKRYEGRTFSRPETQNAEPYMAQGYQSAAPTPSRDPVYAAFPGLWQSPSYAPGAQQTMEDQYGLYEQIRNHADWERLNEHIAMQKVTSAQGCDDEDMVM